MPGPPVIVCRGDTVDVTVFNHLNTASFTLHWHGTRVYRSIWTHMHSVAKILLKELKQIKTQGNTWRTSRSTTESRSSLNAPFRQRQRECMPLKLDPCMGVEWPSFGIFLIPHEQSWMSLTKLEVHTRNRLSLFLQFPVPICGPGPRYPLLPLPSEFPAWRRSVRSLHCPSTRGGGTTFRVVRLRPIWAHHLPARVVPWCEISLLILFSCRCPIIMITGIITARLWDRLFTWLLYWYCVQFNGCADKCGFVLMFILCLSRALVALLFFITGTLGRITRTPFLSMERIRGPRSQGKMPLVSKYGENWRQMYKEATV